MGFNELPAGTVAVGVDGSLSSERALTFAIDQALAERRSLTLVHAVGAVERLWLDSRMNLVVVGSHHGGAASEALFGSVAASVVEHATCPVAVIPTGERG